MPVAELRSAYYIADLMERSTFIVDRRGLALSRALATSLDLMERSTFMVDRRGLAR